MKFAFQLLIVLWALCPVEGLAAENPLICPYGHTLLKDNVVETCFDLEPIPTCPICGFERERNLWRRVSENAASFTPPVNSYLQNFVYVGDVLYRNYLHIVPDTGTPYQMLSLQVRDPVEKVVTQIEEYAGKPKSSLEQEGKVKVFRFPKTKNGFSIEILVFGNFRIIQVFPESIINERQPVAGGDATRWRS